jgi:acetyl esterase/lipase
MFFLKKIFPVIFFLIGIANAQTIKLWENGAPDNKGNEPKDIPTLTVYTPETGKSNGSAIVICPGGAYTHLASHEGEDYAKFLNMYGITAFVLKYRLGKDGYHHPAMWNDVSRAIRYIRYNAKNYNILPNHIGVMGSSAGGHLASTVITHNDTGFAFSDDPIQKMSSRPDLGILCYPVISMDSITHSGSRENLLGKNPSKEMIDFLSSEKQVTKNTPPCFIWHTFEDNAVSVENSLNFAKALKEKGVPFDLHIYQKGRHGIGLGDKAPFNNTHPWTKDLIFWLKEQGWIK